MSEITLKNVSKKYGNGNFAVREFNLDIHDKEFIIFVGPSGCGKSTVGNLIVRLLKETGGGVLADEDWTDDLRDAASALEPGQISGLLETEEGVSILRRLPADSAAVKEAYFDQQLQDAAGHSEIQWTDACAALNSETFWNAVKRGESID